MSSRPRRLLKTPSKEKPIFAGNNETPIENASVKSSTSTGIRGKRKIRRTEDLINLSLVFPEEKKVGTVSKSPLQTVSPNKNEVKKKHNILHLSKFGSEFDEVKENLEGSYVSPRLKSPISKTDKKKRKKVQDLDKNNGNTANDSHLQKTRLQGETSIIEENVIQAASCEAHHRRVVKTKRLLKAQTTESAEEKSLVGDKLADKNSADEEKQENYVLPSENRTHQRKVVKAKRLLKAQNTKEKSEEKTAKIENCVTNMRMIDTEMEDTNSFVSELQEALKKRRSKMQRQPHVTEDHVIMSEVKSPRNEESKSFDKTATSEEVDNNKKDASELQGALKKRRSKMQRPPDVTEDHVIVSEKINSSRNEDFKCFDKTMDKTETSEEVEENKRDASELQEASKKRRSKMQRPPYVTENHVTVSEVKDPRNEESKSFDKTATSEEVEENKKDASKIQGAVKKRGSKMQTPPYVTEDHVIVSEVQSPRNEESTSFDNIAPSEEGEENKKDVSVIIISDETITEESDDSKNTVTITTLKSPISPSTTSEMPSPIHFKSPIEKILHFDTSNEEIHPSTNGTIEPTAKRRRTFELEYSVNDITLLKSVSKNDSIRMASLPNSDEDISAPKLRNSKITLRRKWEIKNDRLSKVSPPWLNFESPLNANESSESGKDSSINEDTDVENTPPRTKQKSQCESLRKNLLTKGVSENGYIEKTPLKNERKSRSFSVSMEKAGTAKPPTAKKHVSSVKIPNFAAIHQRAFDRMENLSEYKKRKEERAKMLLSGQKPVAFKTPISKKKKELRFAPGTREKEQPLDFIPLPSTPMPLKRAIRDSVDSVDSPKTPQVSKNFNFNPPPPRPIPTPKPRSVGKTEATKVQNKILTPKLQFNFKNLILPEFKFGNVNQFNFGKPQPSSSNDFNRFGFNSRPLLAKKEEFKAMVANKCKPSKATVESRRVVIKGVRSNRRFDLLMEMRKGK